MSKNINQLLTEEAHDFDSLISIMNILRSDNGCPWDKEQSHQSIRKCLIEETYEVVDAIDNNDESALREELGDLIFQIMFHSKIEDEKGHFSIDDVIHDICCKMINRHPHVFNYNGNKSSDSVQLSWDDIKLKEKKLKSVVDSMYNIPNHLPSLIKAQKVHNKARSRLGLGFKNKNEAIDFAKKHADVSFVDSIFALAAAAEFDGIDMEMELNKYVMNFIKYSDNEI